MIGDTLKKEREKQKLSVKDVEQATSIRSVYIDALEKGEYDKLPGEVYAKGFIKNYGNFLELNGEELVRQFIMEISPAVTATEDSQVNDSNSENKIAAKNIGQKYQSNSKNESEKNSESRSFVFAAAALILIIIGGIFYNLSGEIEPVEVAQNEKIVQPENKPVETPTVEKAVEVAQIPEPQPVAPPPQPVAPPSPPVNDVNLQATFSGDCWTRVIVDGAMVYEGMINAGQTFDWKGTQSVNILLGNAGAAQFVMNGQNVGSLGGYGDVVEHTFTFN